MMTATEKLRPRVVANQKAAAFYDLDGTLCSTNIVHAYAFYARNQPTISGSLLKSASILASVPFFVAADAYSRKLFNEMFYRRYKGESEDRLKLMAQRMFDEIVRPGIYRQSYDMIRQSREAGYRQVLSSGLGNRRDRLAGRAGGASSWNGRLRRKRTRVRKRLRDWKNQTTVACRRH
jgi:hypothetical protein